MAASAAVLGALSGGHGHGDSQAPATQPVAAVSLLFDCAATDFDADSVLEILSACYEAVLHTEGLSQEVLESDTDNDNCCRFIDFQWAVITRFA
ncbi:hypothetical protein [Streptomyces sp. NPDC058291]|uniref:hypothetical protein n=1 Tax=Streptomyces sp. NPDC058291 TaxID=3346427 RepID=UPI0036E6BD84